MRDSCPGPLHGRVVLITGASSGLGEATARACARAGARLGLAARREERLHALAEELEAGGSEVLVLRVDMRDAVAIRAMADAARERFGRIDALVANAGVAHSGSLAEMPDEQIREQVEVNLLGVIRSAQAVLPAMLAAGRGHILAVASVSAEITLARAAVYGATKAGVVAFCEGLQRDVGSRGVAVTAILPGYVATPMTAGHPFPMPPASRFGDVVVGLIRRPRARVVFPAWYAPLIALNRRAPWLIDAIARRRGGM